MSDHLDEKLVQEIEKIPAFNTGNHDVGPMLPETEKVLSQFFRPFMKRLSDLLHDPRFLWNDL